MKGILFNKWTLTALLVAAGLAGLFGWQRNPVLGWYYVRQLSHSFRENRESWASKVASLESAALPRLFEGLRDSDAMVCGNMQYALLLIARKWGPTDARSQQLIEDVQEQFDEFSSAGREKAMLLLASILQQDGPKPLPPRLTKVVSEILLAAERKNELRAVSLLVAAELVEAVQPGQWVDVCREMAQRGLSDEMPAARIAAVQLLLRAPMRKDRELLEKAVPLLGDADPSVRRAALVALAAENECVREDALLPLLHDEDVEVQFLTEMALRQRGLSDDELKMARMISDKNPAVRMGVLPYLHQVPGLNLSEWLRQLCNDSAAAVRAAAVRAAGENLELDFAPRLREMAEHDPSATVRQNARYYLQQRAARTARE